MFVKWRVRYIENLDITNLRENDQNVRYIEVIVNDWFVKSVPLYLFGMFNLYPYLLTLKVVYSFQESRQLFFIVSFAVMLKEDAAFKRLITIVTKKLQLLNLPILSCLLPQKSCG